MELRMGYRKPQTKQTMDPIAMTGTRPQRSVSLPLNGREIPAVNVKRAMINPLCSGLPIWLRWLGSSGIIMLKLAQNRSELKHNKIKGTVYIDLDSSALLLMI